MTTLYLGLAVFLLLTISAGLVRMWCGPTAAERRQARRVLGTSGVAMVLLLAQAFTASGLRDTVVLFSLLAVVTVVAFTLLTWSDPGDPHNG